jgi:hypothetical protein
MHRVLESAVQMTGSGIFNGAEVQLAFTTNYKALLKQGVVESTSKISTGAGTPGPSELGLQAARGALDSKGAQK